MLITFCTIDLFQHQYSALKKPLLFFKIKYLFQEEELQMFINLYDRIIPLIRKKGPNPNNTISQFDPLLPFHRPRWSLVHVNSHLLSSSIPDRLPLPLNRLCQPQIVLSASISNLQERVSEPAIYIPHTVIHSRLSLGQVLPVIRGISFGTYLVQAHIWNSQTRPADNIDVKNKFLWILRFCRKYIIAESRW